MGVRLLNAEGTGKVSIHWIILYNPSIHIASINQTGCTQTPFPHMSEVSRLGLFEVKQLSSDLERGGGG